VIAPGANDLDQFWGNVIGRKTELSDLPNSRWDVDKLIGSSAELARAFKTRLGSTVDLPHIDALLRGAGSGIADALDSATILAVGVTVQALCDAGFQSGTWASDRVQVVFGQVALRAEECATEKRVQYAILSELAREAMREAGLPEPQVRAVVAEAQLRFDRDNRRFSRDTLDYFSGLPAARYAAQAFGFSGEVLSVDAACASSLAALKIASNALQAGKADVVLAGGVSYHLLPEYYVGLGLLDALSSRGGRPFHRDADGFVPAEAAGAVVLKRLGDARRTGDRIYAVITGHGVASDGHGLTIYSANPAGQRLAMSRALTAAGIDATAIDLIEAHGPGAPLGDRAEMASIAGVYAERPFLPALAIASAKSLVGHSSSAGAMLSLIRAAMALDSKVLPPTGGNGDTAPDLPFGPTLELSRVARPWVSVPGRSRRAAVNSFGMTGVDHHVVLEEAQPEPSRNDVSRTALDHPAARPGHPLNAARFVITESPVSLPQRQPLYPLRNRTFALLGNAEPLASELTRVFAERGARLVRLVLADPVSDADVRVALGNDPSVFDGVIDVSGFQTGSNSMAQPSAALWARLKTYSDRTFSVLRSLYEHFASGQSSSACYVAVSSVAGAPNTAGDPLGAFFQGIARALKQELPAMLCKAIDVDPRMPAARAAEAIANELEDGNDRVDVRYSDQRLVTTLRRADFADTTPVFCHLNPGDVFVFSGGGRGVVYQCAAALARRGLHVVVTGRRPLPEPELAWVKMTDAEFGEFRRAELVRRRGSEGPAQIIRMLDGLDLQRQAYANISKAQALGLSLYYETCDINDAASVASLAARIRAQFSRIDGVGHGAMIEHSAALPRKSQQAIDATLSTKVLGLVNLIAATSQDRLKVFMTFGSGVGRYGNSGQTDYAAANAVVAAMLQAHSKTTLRNTHCVTMDWPAWESLGATANRDIAELLRKAGVTSISPEEGVYWFLSELALGEAPEVVICGERMLQSWPFLARDADGKGERALEVDDHGYPLISSRWPMVDRLVRTSETHDAEHQIALGRDLYMPQHLLNGLAVVPAAFGCEMLAEGAALAHPGLHVQEISDFHVDASLGLPRGEPVTARVTIRQSVQTQSERTVLAELRSPLAAKLKLTTDRLHHSARVVLTPTSPSSLGAYEFPRRAEVVRATSFYALTKDPVHLGQLFSIARWIQVFEGQSIGIIEPPAIDEMFAEYAAPRLIACPLVLDAALQVAGSWDGYRNGFISVPIGIGSVKLGRAPMANEQTRAHARLLRIENPDVYYAISIVGDNCERLVELSNVHLRRIGNPITIQ
jgi:3-oxoacyl-(acyl-carrier-protein) synthase/NAD(P)-dependent dehydrogenase (short-subunit alcohol dehydrogenase family)